MRIHTPSAVILVLAILGWGEPHARAEDERPEAVKVPEEVAKHLGERTVAILSGADRAEAFRLEKQPAAKAGKDTIGPDGLQWPIKATNNKLDAKFAARVRDLLFDESTTIPSGAGGARGWVAFRLWKEKESVTVVVDFEGYHLYLVTRDAEGKQLSTAIGGFLFNAKTQDFDNGVLLGRIKALALEAFPKDADIKALGK
jgi:hypothetical protein